MGVMLCGDLKGMNVCSNKSYHRCSKFIVVLLIIINNNFLNEATKKMNVQWLASKLLSQGLEKDCELFLSCVNGDLTTKKKLVS